MKIYHSKEYLKERLGSKSYLQIARENDVAPWTIQRWMRKYDFTKKKVSWSENELSLLKENYTLKSDIRELFPHRSLSSINHKASRLGLRKTIRSCKYGVNHYFFKEWSPKMAYVLGWFFSDGNVSSKENQINIHINQKDHAILEKIKAVLSSNRPIGTYSNSSYLRINSEMLTKDIIRLGCKPRKSLILRFPRIEDEFLPHFIRGYFDGDGSITFNKPNVIKIYFLGTKDFLEEMQRRLNKVLGLAIRSLYAHHNIWLCRYYGDDARKLSNWMYENAEDLYLKRKKERFDKHIMLRKNDRV